MTRRRTRLAATSGRPHTTHGEEVAPSELDGTSTMGLAALRIVEALRATDRDGDIGRFATELGTAVFERGAAKGVAVVPEVAELKRGRGIDAPLHPAAGG